MSRYRQNRKNDRFANFGKFVFLLPFRILGWLIRWICRHWIPSEAPSEEAIRWFYKSPGWVNLARQVKDEHKRRHGSLFCEWCGVDSTSARIVTDHKMPIRTHWHLRLNKQNLRILCDVCNRHKGSTVETPIQQPSRLQRLVGPRISLWAR